MKLGKWTHLAWILLSIWPLLDFSLQRKEEQSIPLFRSASACFTAGGVNFPAHRVIIQRTKSTLATAPSWQMQLTRRGHSK